MTQDTRATLSAFFRRTPEVRLAILFGSLAGGTEGPESDADIAVAGEKPLETDLRMRLIESLAMALNRPVDLIDLRSAGYFVLRQALVHGEVVYCADRSILADVYRRMVFDAVDFAPYHRRALAERRRAWIGI
jgi:predicted nucleotidyltransferase